MLITHQSQWIVYGEYVLNTGGRDKLEWGELMSRWVGWASDWLIDWLIDRVLCLALAIVSAGTESADLIKYITQAGNTGIWTRSSQDLIVRRTVSPEL